MIETWVPIQGYEGSYEVSDHGQVRSLDRYRRNNISDNVLHRGRILKPWKSGGTGPLQINFHNKNPRKMFRVHRLVAQHFIPNPENFPEVNHIDFNIYNNHVTNLEWVNHEENIFHAMVNGRFHKSAKTHPGMAIKLTNEDVEMLRQLASEGASVKELIEWFPIGKSQVYRIIKGVSR